METEDSEGTVLEHDAGTLDLQSEVNDNNVDNEETNVNSSQESEDRVESTDADEAEQIEDRDTNGIDNLDVQGTTSSEDAGVDTTDMNNGSESNLDAEDDDPLAGIYILLHEWDRLHIYLIASADNICEVHNL